MSATGNSRPLLSWLTAGLDFVVRQCVTFCSTLWLRLTLSLLGCRYGKRLRADGRVVVRIRRNGAVTLGENVKIKSRFMANLVGMEGPTVFHCIGDGRIQIGNKSGCSSAVFSSRSSIQVGDNVLIGGNARIYDHDFHPLDHATRCGFGTAHQNIRTAPVVIGNGVFIGINVIILKGVHVGDRSVIGAGSVVTLKEIPPDSLVAGNPARVVRNLRSAS